MARARGVPWALAGALLVLSSVTHLAQLRDYKASWTIVPAACFGLAYLALGVWLLRSRSRRALQAGAILPAVGGTLGALRYALVHPNPFSVFHIALDAVIVPCCLWTLRKMRDKGPRGRT